MCSNVRLQMKENTSHLEEIYFVANFKQPHLPLKEKAAWVADNTRDVAGLDLVEG